MRVESVASKFKILHRVWSGPEGGGSLQRVRRAHTNPILSLASKRSLTMKRLSHLSELRIDAQSAAPAERTSTTQDLMRVDGSVHTRTRPDQRISGVSGVLIHEIVAAKSCSRVIGIPPPRQITDRLPVVRILF
jgi:hypothetical protein